MISETPVLRLRPTAFFDFHCSWLHALAQGHGPCRFPDFERMGGSYDCARNEAIFGDNGFGVFEDPDAF